ncbi:S1C family serine protease [Streptomyces sp. HUAS ZL42]|uniref:S1C family serine protease n=1 Tax=Streptomyces sp. HUAS ZL42 TaxID=3231715 RepID=UPI00345E97AE
MSASLNLSLASALLVAMCGAPVAIAGELSPGGREQAKVAVVQVVGDSAAGTGFVYDASRGLVVTTAFVTAGQSSLEVLQAGKQQPVPAQLLGSDLCQDLAVLKLTSPLKGLKGLQFGDSDLVVDDDAITSLGYTDAGTAGADVVATAGEVDEPAETVGPTSSDPDLPSLIYHSAEVKPGTQGGPVLNSDGEVVGINTGTSEEEDPLIGKTRRVYEAISSNNAKSVLPGLAAGAMKNDPGWWLRNVSDPNLPQETALAGIAEASVQDAQNRLQDKGIDGLFVVDVRKNSPAGSAKIQQGAVITTANGEDVSSFSELCDVIEPASAGDKLNLSGVYSGVGAAGHKFGDSWTVELTLEGNS